MISRAIPLGVVLAGALLLATATGAAAEERLEGKVTGTKLTRCDFKPGGCEGTMVLETSATGKTESVSVKVPLGTPIRKGADTVYLPALRGSRVELGYVTEKGEKVARSIDVK